MLVDVSVVLAELKCSCGFCLTSSYKFLSVKVPNSLLWSLGLGNLLSGGIHQTLGVTVVFEVCLGLIPVIHGTWVKVVSAESLQSKLKTFRVAPGRIEEQVPTS